MAFYKFAPAPGEDNRLTAALAEYTKPSEFWEKLTVKHLLPPLTREEIGVVRCLGLNYADHAVRARVRT